MAVGSLLKKMIRRIRPAPVSPVRGPEAWLDSRPWLDQPEADIDGYVASLPRQPDYDLAGQLKHWREHGYLILRNAVPHEEIDAVLADLDYLIANHRDVDVGVTRVSGVSLSSRKLDSLPVDEAGFKIDWLHAHSRAAARLSLTKVVVEFLSHVLRDRIAVLQSLAFLKGSEQPVHTDYVFTAAQKRLGHFAQSWIALEDIHPDSGPLGFYPGHHRPEQFGFFDWGNGSIVFNHHTRSGGQDYTSFLQEGLAKAGAERVDFIAKKGDVLVWHAALPHQGGRVNDPSRTRKSYVTGYTSLADLPSFLIPPQPDRPEVSVVANGGISYRPPHLLDRGLLPSWQASD